MYYNEKHQKKKNNNTVQVYIHPTLIICSIVRVCMRCARVSFCGRRDGFHGYCFTIEMFPRTGSLISHF